MHTCADRLLENQGSVVACPRCRGTLEPGLSKVGCTNCGHSYLLPRGFPDFAPHIVDPPGLGQRFMESKSIAGVYETHFRPLFTRLGSTLSYDDEQDYLDTWLTPTDGPLLDIACGTGRYSRILGHRHGAERVLALDLSLPMLRLARERALEEQLGELLFVRGSAESLPLRDRSLGAVNFFGALHLVPHPEEAIAEIGRCLEPGGTLACLTAVRADDRRWRQWGEALFSALATFRFFTSQELTHWLDRAELELLDLTRRQSALLFAAQKR